jgi:hypothetical protein
MFCQWLKFNISWQKNSHKLKANTNTAEGSRLKANTKYSFTPHASRKYKYSQKPKAESRKRIHRLAASFKPKQIQP